MKVLLVLENSPFTSGGIERHCRNIIDLFKGDPDVTVDFLSKEKIGHRYLKVIRKFVFNRKELAKAIVDYDVIHIHGFASFVSYQALKAAIRASKKVVYTAHYHPFETLTNPLFGKLFFHFLIKPLLPEIDTIITINSEDSAFFKRYNSRVVMIPNWLTGIESVLAAKKPDMILCVGINRPNKSLEYLNDIPFDRWQVHCVTDSETGLDSRITVHKGISDQELSRLYSEAGLLVAPSRYEAFSYVVLEALERGTPVLISDRVRIGDYLGGVDGVAVFAYGDHTDFVAQLDQASAQTVDTEKIKKLFAPENIKKRLEQSYK